MRSSSKRQWEKGYSSCECDVATSNRSLAEVEGSFRFTGQLSAGWSLMMNGSAEPFQMSN